MCFCALQCHSAYRGSSSIAPPIFNLSTRWSGKSHTPTAFTPKKNSEHLLNRRLGCPWGRYEFFFRGKKPLAPAENRSTIFRTFDPSPSYYTDWATPAGSRTSAENKNRLRCRSKCLMLHKEHCRFSEWYCLQTQAVVKLLRSYLQQTVHTATAVWLLKV
jgi:hypothetical protein